MQRIKNTRIISLIIWLIIAVVSVVSMPNLADLVREKGQITLPEDAQSLEAQQLLKEMNENGEENYQIIAVYTSKDGNPLTTEAKEEISSVIAQLQKQKQQLGITDILSHLDNEETEKQLTSEDETTILTQISVDQRHGSITKVRDELNEIIELDQVQTYLTGSGLVSEDFVQSTEKGIQKTEIIAIIFIILVLIAVFRSPIVPFVSLFTVGISYIVSLAIVAHLVDQFNFPFSNFTQIFLIVVLFGIGTDYNILLYTRFKEELGKQDGDRLSAIKTTYQTAGKTVLFSGIAVFIGFMALYLAKFGLYQSASAVAIGVAVLILVLITLNPFFMAVLGKKLFWPSKNFTGHSDSKIWGLLSKASVLKPIRSLLFVAIICIPSIWIYSGDVNFNDLVEVSDSYESKQGINVIEQHFPPGFSSPATLVLKTDEALNNQQSLQQIDELTEKISKIDGVEKVLSPTRPTGEKIPELYMNDQVDKVHAGLGEANNGVGQINDGLTTAEEGVGSADKSGLDNVQVLIDGTSEVKNGVGQLGSAIGQLTEGFTSGATGAKQLEDGLRTLNENVATLETGTAQLYDGYSELQTGLNAFSDSFQSLTGAIEGAKQGYAGIEASMKSYIEGHPEAAGDPNIQTVLGIASKGQEQLTELSQQLQDLSPKYKGAMESFKQANTSLSTVKDGLSQLQIGVEQLQTGANSLNNGLVTGAEGSQKISDNTAKLDDGLLQINDGQKQLLNGLSDLTGQLENLQSGLSDSTDGLDQISSGLTEAQGYLKGLSESSSSEKFFIPEENLNSEEFTQALDMYMSEDRKITKMTIIFDVNPFSMEAMDIAKEIEEQAESAIEGTNLSNARVALDGKSAQNADLQTISSDDFSRTVIIMLIGIGIILIVITRSIMQPIFIIGSLLLTYWSSLGLGEWISKQVLGVDLLSWNVPFFSFIMIVALGVDYSIFLMMRYREQENSQSAIVEAAKHIGGVVISAAIILGGTFAALMPSGVVTLIQVAIVVIIGLFLLSFVMLPILIPALQSLQYSLTHTNKKSNVTTSNSSKEV